MRRWQYIQDRSGWTTTDHNSKMWIAWFLILVIIGEIFERVLRTDLDWVTLLALGIIARFIARFIVGAKKKKEERDDG